MSSRFFHKINLHSRRHKKQLNRGKISASRCGSLYPSAEGIQNFTLKITIYEIWDFHGGEVVDVDLLGCNAAPCGLVSRYRRFGAGIKMHTCFSEAMVSICKSTWRHNAEVQHRHCRVSVYNTMRSGRHCQHAEETSDIFPQSSFTGNVRAASWNLYTNTAHCDELCLILYKASSYELTVNDVKAPAVWRVVFSCPNDI
jgi:hypothetical protein